jgi:hypothetical protein
MAEPVLSPLGLFEADAGGLLEFVQKGAPR